MGQDLPMDACWQPSMVSSFIIALESLVGIFWRGLINIWAILRTQAQSSLDEVQTDGALMSLCEPRMIETIRYSQERVHWQFTG